MKRQVIKKLHHCVFSLNYHLVLVTKYRHKCINDAISQRLQEIIKNLCSRWIGQLLEFNATSDHAHMLVSLPPTLQLSTFVNNVKTVTARRIRSILAKGNNMYTLPNETSLTIKRILQNIVKIQQKDFSVIKQILACSQHTSKERRTLHTTCSRLWQLLDKVKGADIVCLSAMINNLPNISHAELIFLNEQILPVWLKFICGDILSILCLLFTINRSPQLLSIASDVLLLCRPPVLDKLDNAQTYIKQLLEDGAPIEMLSDCVI